MNVRCVLKGNEKSEPPSALNTNNSESDCSSSCHMESDNSQNGDDSPLVKLPGNFAERILELEIETQNPKVSMQTINE